jgi:hypothetical protein
MKLFVKTLVAIALLTLSASPASADSMCAAGNTCTVTLTMTNVTQLAGIVVTVTIDNTGTNTVLSFQLTTNPVSGTNTALGIDQVGWNGGVLSTSTGGSWAGKNASPSKSSMDGFGTFNVQASDPGGSGGISSAITFTLAGLVTNFPANASGNEFTVHIRFTGNGLIDPATGNAYGCSGFVGGQTGTTSVNNDPGCGTPIPEPASLALFGTGLLGLAGVIRRRLRS